MLPDFILYCVCVTNGIWKHTIEAQCTGGKNAFRIQREHIVYEKTLISPL
jgi:hypothetical protein